ncbi:MAG: RiPP maturation radical SAM C-methyltransferase [Nitrospirota bacterium]|nr:RiPP maturation radical SAM C-methyltransferase [Nitrospirota bacterium]
MPFGYSKYPSIQLGTLSALLKSQGIGVTSHYLNLRFAHKIGVPLYELLCEKRGLLGEWLFSHLLFRDNPKHADYPRTFKPVFEELARESGQPIAFFEELAGRGAPQFLTWAMAAIDWGQYKVVGFTSTFDQNVASLSLAKLIKDLYPDVRIVFGGANFDGEMGLEHLRAFTWVDYVVVGEGEEVFPPLVRQILDGKEDMLPKGVACRREGRICFEPNFKLFSEFQRTGPPDYDDYFRQAAELGGEPSQGLDRILLYEGSRGCWWGEKHHCTFCGLNAQSMKFRAKAPAQVAQELDYLSSRYDSTRFRLVDNIIDMKYVDELFGKFAADHLDLDVFIETKSNLHKKQIQTLAQGGVKCMQPGIESLSQAQLHEMDKGVSPMQNVQCLKWSLYYHVDVSWNILLGFPQETDEDYRKQIELIPSLLHLQPPQGTGKFWLERFSPYFTRPSQYGIRITGPGLAYAYVYDPRVVDLEKIAYDFEYEIDHKVSPGLYEELTQLVRDWRQRHASADKPFLYYSKSLSYVTVYDGRPSDRPMRMRYDWPASSIIEQCNEAPKSKEQIQAGLKETGRGEVHDPASVENLLAALVARRILYAERGKYFTLALPTNATF